MIAQLIYKIVSAAEWIEAERAGVFNGSVVDRRDGFIHFSTAGQVCETAARHFSGQDNLRLVAVSTDALEIRWEPSRGGALFPHLYGPLPLTAVRAVHVLPLESGGHHFPPDVAADIERTDRIIAGEQPRDGR